jgi:hypothetical protein
MLKVTVAPADPDARDHMAAFLDHPAAAVQSPPVAVKGRQLVRIRVLVKMPPKRPRGANGKYVRELPLGAGGLIVRDSLGGETLQYRTTAALPDWSEVTLLRRVPTDGELTVTLGLAGFGTAYFDDLRIEPLETLRGELAGPRTAPAPPAASLPAAPRANRRASASRPGNLLR